MKKFEKVKEYQDLDFYSIETNSAGVKQIHIFGFTYYGDDNPNYVDVCSFIEDLDSFICHVADDESYVDSELSVRKQYVEVFTEEEIVEIINQYFDGRPADYILNYSEITMNTPCGNYVR